MKRSRWRRSELRPDRARERRLLSRLQARQAPQIRERT